MTGDPVSHGEGGMPTPPLRGHVLGMGNSTPGRRLARDASPRTPADESEGGA
jgi:hypothetical protein